MQRDFRYLRDKYGIAGAREIFEKVCTQLFQSKYSNAYPVKVSKGDDGIDIFVGNYNESIDVYQCKYFIDGIGSSQQKQIRESFKTAINSNNYKLNSWTLCLPCILTINEHKWWSNWKAQQSNINKILINLYDGSYLISELIKIGLYDRVFDEDIRNTLNEIASYLNSEKQRIYNEIIHNINDFEEIDYNNCIFIKKLENANITNISSCKNEFFNAEIAEYSIKCKGDERDLKVYQQLKMKIYSIWDTQFRLYANDTDGNELLARTYLRIEDTDTTTLKSLDEINLIAKKGILHQLADECSIGWLKDYQKKLEEFLAIEKEGEQL